MITWVVGAGGLLGGAIQRRTATPFASSPVPWAHPELAGQVLRTDATRFFAQAGDKPWAILWAAGEATTSSSRESSMTELMPLQGLLAAINSRTNEGPGALFLTSSAGGVYAGSSDPPFTSATPPAPLSPYGELKLAQEQLCADQLQGACSLVIGRVSNLYGSGQNLHKLQGLISRLAVAAVTRQPINIFVPLDTIRDYIFADDAATSILDITYRAARNEQSGSDIQVIASGQATTVGYLLQTMNHITKRHIPVAFGSHVSASAQSPDLRLQPTTPPKNHMPLPAGMMLVYQDILTRMQQSNV